ncbi:hypothetical protein G9C85_18510 [Halorubellus sp. JP-L1]|uniref:hypothetical protein n=1 Tax=Halorubellus sp. JP-L1 TaxID=2715753 RepID=UPI001408EB68|nr:hypothetical protein [Halorubellus sp. JP-L1]NHN43616.1 hypothetical protein [Halorubellus sp. JP-L1]
MNRRSYLAALGASITLAGCSASDDSVDSLSVTSPTVAQGDVATIAIEATDVGSMRFTEIPTESELSDDERQLQIEFEGATFTPPPEFTWQTHPPTWSWSSEQRIEGAVPVRTLHDTPPGTYRISVTVFEDGSDEEKTESQITVEGDFGA